MTSPHALQTKALLPGDVLLHMGAGELSKLIAWVGDSAYSHAAMVIRGGQLIEAAAAGVRHAGLAERTKMMSSFRYVDVYRPLKPAAGDVRGIDALIAAAEVYLGRPYPMTSLVTLGVACAVRNKIPGDERLRQAVRMALDLVIENDPSQVVCSELVYRGYDEAVTQPAHAFRLPVRTRAAGTTPLPKIDFAALLAECLDDYQRSRRNTTLSAEPPSADAVDLDAMLARARNRLGVEGSLLSAGEGYAPNPKAILPADLEFSSGLRIVGRLAMTA